MPVNPTTLKALIDTQITNETVDFAITPAEVGGRMKDAIDYTTEQIAGVVATPDATNVVKGKIQLTGDLGGTAAAPTVPALSGKENLSNKSTNVATDGASDTKYPSVKAVKTYADGLVVGLLDDRGNYNASGNTFPATGGSGSAGAVLTGDLWFISVAGTLGGVAVPIGASVRALVDAPAQTSANWSVLNVGLGFTPENVVNKSTNVTTDGASDNKYPSVKAVKDYVDANSGSPYNEYVCALYQTGTSNPGPQVPTIDTISSDVVNAERFIGYERLSTGTYTVYIAYKIAGQMNRFNVMINGNVKITSKVTSTAGPYTIMTYTFETYTPTGVLSDGLLSGEIGSSVTIKGIF